MRTKSIRVASGILATFILTAWALTATAAPDAPAPTAAAEKWLDRFHFANRTECGIRLARPDAFTASLSPLDRSARLGTDQPVSGDAFLNHLGKQGSDWPEPERERVTRTLRELAENPRMRLLPLPARVILAHTTGREDDGNAYTRGNTVFFRAGRVPDNPERLQHLLAHEFFHVASRRHPKLRDAAYAGVGFLPLPHPLVLPETLAARRLTNPDAPRLGHGIQLEHQGQLRIWVPVIFSKEGSFDPGRHKRLFDLLDFAYLAVEPDGETMKAVQESGEPLKVHPFQDADFLEALRRRIGGNTHYIIHPEEILADHFALLVLKKESAPSRERLQALEDLLRKWQP